MRPAVAATALLILAACGDSDPGLEGEGSGDDRRLRSASTSVSGLRPETLETTTTTTTSTTTTSTTTTEPPLPVGWTQVETSGPGARSNAALVVDAATQTLWLHGGRAGGQPLDDLWRLDLESNQWEEIATDAKPSARFSHVAIWDGARNRIVLTTGQVGPNTFVSDVWAFDPTTSTWSELVGSNVGPTDRYGSCWGYDAAGNRLLISHGFTNAGRFDDTWAFDLTTDTWQEASPEGDRPIRRCLHACSYDATTGELVLFGGATNDAFAVGDTWRLGDDGWVEVTGAAPAARRFGAMVPAASGGVLLVGGGLGTDDTHGDTWSLSTTEWTQLELDNAPSPRHSHAVVANPRTGVIYMFGGDGPEGELDDLWQLVAP